MDDGEDEEPEAHADGGREAEHREGEREEKLAHADPRDRDRQQREQARDGEEADDVEEGEIEMQRAAVVMAQEAPLQTAAAAVPEFRADQGAAQTTEFRTLDEETQDFRVRTKSTLEDPTRAWPPLDPEGTVAARRWNERDGDSLVGAFAEERATSVAWLRSLKTPDWHRTRVEGAIEDVKAFLEQAP